MNANEIRARNTRVETEAKQVGLAVWRQLGQCVNGVVVTSIPTGNEYDNIYPALFTNVYVNGVECILACTIDQLFSMDGMNNADGVIIITMEQYAGKDAIDLRSVPDTWRKTMRIPAHVKAVNVHISADMDEHCVVYGLAAPVCSGSDVLTALRADGVHVGYSRATSLDPNMAL